MSTLSLSNHIPRRLLRIPIHQHFGGCTLISVRIFKPNSKWQEVQSAPLRMLLKVCQTTQQATEILNMLLLSKGTFTDLKSISSCLLEMILELVELYCASGHTIQAIEIFDSIFGPWAYVSITKRFSVLLLTISFKRSLLSPKFFNT
jgi:hypothetical protein